MKSATAILRIKMRLQCTKAEDGVVLKQSFLIKLVIMTYAFPAITKNPMIQKALHKPSFAIISVSEENMDVSLEKNRGHSSSDSSNPSSQSSTLSQNLFVSMLILSPA